MEKLVANEFTKTLILLTMGCAGVFALFIKLVIRLKGKFRPYQKSTLIYLLLTLITFALITFSTRWFSFKNYLIILALYQFCFLLLGILHIYWMQQYLKWSGSIDALWAELTFTLFTGFIGSLVFIIIFQFNNKEAFVYDMAGSIIFFIIPWFVYQTFYRAITIPSKVLKQW